MALSDHLPQNVVGKAGACKTCIWYDQLDDADRDRFDTWVEGGGQSAMLWRACCAEGLECGVSTFRDHLNNHHKKRD